MELQMKQLRVRMGLKQSEVAQQLGMPTRRYGSYERGERAISLIEAARVADVLDCTLDELAGREYSTALPAPLTTNERDLIGLYRDANSQGQATIMGVAQLQKRVDAASDDGPDTDHQRRTA